MSKVKVSTYVEHKPAGYEPWRDDLPIRRPNVGAIMKIVFIVGFVLLIIGALAGSYAVFYFSPTATEEILYSLDTTEDSREESTEESTEESSATYTPTASNTSRPTHEPRPTNTPTATSTPTSQFLMPSQDAQQRQQTIVITSPPIVRPPRVVTVIALQTKVIVVTATPTPTSTATDTSTPTSTATDTATATSTATDTPTATSTISFELTPEVTSVP